MNDVNLFKALEEITVDAGNRMKTARAAIRPVEGTPEGEDNPHTNLDRETDTYLADHLPVAFGGVAKVSYLTEERPDDLSRLKADQVLIVDPIDGTRSLLLGNPDAVVSVALWRRGIGIVWGCVYNPFSVERFVAIKGGGARLNDAPIMVSRCVDPAEATLLVSRSETDHGLLNKLEGVRKRVLGSVAFKMCLVSAGRAEGTLTAYSRSEWDIAAATLILEEAGGRVVDGAGNPIEFNRLDLEIRGLVATNGLIHDWACGLRELLAQ